MSEPAEEQIELADLVVQWPDGAEVRIGELIERPTILVIPRYYGCLPCRDYLSQVSRRHEEIEAAGAGALGVSVGSDKQARWLRAEHGISFPLLVDPERRLHEAIELPRKWWVGLNPKGWANYAKAISHGERQGAIIDPNQLPGLALLDAGATAHTVYRGRALGDYPPLSEVLERLGGWPAELQ
jgi:peroxiredoxin